MPDDESGRVPDDARSYTEPVGLAHVATVSFLASRIAPSIGFFIALTGGAALARSAQRDGPRLGFGASIAAVLQTVAIIGPVRFAVPLTQALTAPALGTMEARGTSRIWQFLTCAVIRTAHNAIGIAFFIFILSGGLDSYTDTYDAVVGFVDFLPFSLPEGETAALVATAIGLISWTLFASAIQVFAYRRALRKWQEPPVKPHKPPDDRAKEKAVRRTFDPRAITLSAAVLFGLLIASTQWILLGSVAAVLVLASLVARADWSVVRTGAGLALLLAVLLFVFTTIGGAGFESAAQRAARAGLLVLTATWMRAAAGVDGIREVSRRTLGRLRRIPSLDEAAAVMDRLDSGSQMRKSATTALEAFNTTDLTPLPLLDSALDWAELEAAEFEPLAPAQPKLLKLHLVDPLLFAVALVPLALLLS